MQIKLIDLLRHHNMSNGVFQEKKQQCRSESVVKEKIIGDKLFGQFLDPNNSKLPQREQAELTERKSHNSTNPRYNDILEKSKISKINIFVARKSMSSSFDAK